MMPFSHFLLTPAVLAAVRLANKFYSRVFGAILMLVIPAQPVYALLATCTVSTSGVNFGVYDVFSASPNEKAGNINVTCSGIGLLVSYDILVSTGGSGSYVARSMSDGSGHSLAYNLYTTASRNIIWYDGTGGTGKVHDGYLIGLFPVSNDYPIYGKIPAGINAYVGSYSDTVIVTVNYQ